MALVLGVVWSLTIGGMGLLASATTEYGHEFVKVFMSIYPRYDMTVGGALLGFLWGFCDGVGAGIILWLTLKLSAAKAKE